MLKNIASLSLLIFSSCTFAESYTSAQFICNLDDYYDPTELHSFTISGNKYTTYGHTSDITITKPLSEGDNENISIEFEQSSSSGKSQEQWTYSKKWKTLTIRSVSYNENSDIIWPVTGSTKYVRCQANIR